MPSIVWGATYLICIPTFAIIYSQFPGEFYHSTAHFEPSLAADQKTLERAIAIAIKKNFVAKHGGESLTISVGRDDRWRDGTVSVEDISVHFLPPPPSENYPRLSFETMQVTVVADLLYGDQQIDIMALQVKGSGFAATAPYVAFPCPSIGSPPLPVAGPTDACLVLDRRVRDRLEAYLEARRGFPSRNTSSHFSRMFYFSAVTITTLGYGDIVPLTAQARGWVTLEIVLGPVLFGLFLNSLVRERPREADRLTLACSREHG